VTFEVISFTAVNITVFWDVELCDLLHGYQISEKFTVYFKYTAVSHPEDEFSSVNDINYITSCNTVSSTDSSDQLRKQKHIHRPSAKVCLGYILNSIVYEVAAQKRRS
jgi:hypothetical protein